MVCAWALVLDQVTAEVEGALSFALESDDAQALATACDLAKTFGLESTAAKFEEAKERVEQKSREVGDDDHRHAEHSLTHSLTEFHCVCVCVVSPVGGRHPQCSSRGQKDLTHMTSSASTWPQETCRTVVPSFTIRAMTVGFTTPRTIDGG